MTMEEYKKIRDKFYTSCLTAPEDCDRYLRAFLDWAGTVLDRMGGQIHYRRGGEE